MKECERADKPGSVVGRPFISNVRRRTPQARNPNVRRATVSRSYLRLLRMGFSKPRRCRRAGALLPHRFSFSPVAARRGACSRGSLLFCGTNPSGRPAQPLAGILPCGARTFLTPEGVRSPGPLAYGILAYCSGGLTANGTTRRCGTFWYKILPLSCLSSRAKARSAA